MHGFIQTDFLHQLSMLVFLTVVSCGFAFMFALVFHWLSRKRK